MEGQLEERVGTLARQCFGDGTALRGLSPLAGDASTRRYARAWLAGPNAPASVVAMILADRGIAMSSDELAVFAAPPSELPYVNVHRFLAGLGVAVPELYLDASDAGLLLLEDVGDLALWDAVQGKPVAEVRRWFAKAIEQLLLIQVDGTARRDDSCLAFQQVFDERLFRWEFEHFIEYGLVQRAPRPVDQADLAALRRHFDDLSRFLDRQPRYLNHRDFHGWNLFVHEGRVRVIDFQDALLAPAPYDLATLLGDRDTPTVIRPEIERELLGDYRRAWEARGGPAWEAGALWDVYAACALQKAFKVVGRFHYLDREKGKPGYLRYLPSTLAQIARLLRQRPDLEEVGRIVRRYIPELPA
jgi:aminoglycoside/choline kinase family phosphotransferase